MSGRRPTVLPLAAALALLLAGCSGNSLLPRSSATGDELETLKRRIVELQRQVTVNELELARLQERVAALEGPGGAESGRAERPAAGGGATGTAPAPAGRPAESQPRPAPAEPFTVIEEDDLDPEPVPPARSGGAPTPAEPAAASPSPRQTEPAAAPGAGATTPQPPPADGQALYDQGYSLYHQGRYADAESAFQRFLQGYPGSDLSDNAQFWIGEARYARRDYRGALAAFRETIERFSEGNKVPDALLKAGLCLEQLGDLGSAREAYSEVVRRYPGTAAAAVAAERRDALP